MGSYDLICDVCGATFEVFHQSFLRDEDRLWPECGSSVVRPGTGPTALSSVIARW